MTKIPPSKGLQPATHFHGESFSLNKLVLPRPAIAYGVQWLGTDLLLDKVEKCFTPVRQIGQQAFFETYESAFESGFQWLNLHPDSPLAIVPLGWDSQFERVVLIQGVLNP